MQTARQLYFTFMLFDVIVFWEKHFCHNFKFPDVPESGCCNHGDGMAAEAKWQRQTHTHTHGAAEWMRQIASIRKKGFKFWCVCDVSFGLFSHSQTHINCFHLFFPESLIPSFILAALVCLPLPSHVANCSAFFIASIWVHFHTTMETMSKRLKLFLLQQLENEFRKKRTFNSIGSCKLPVVFFCVQYLRNFCV